MDDIQRELLAVLRAHGPLSARDLVELVYSASPTDAADADDYSDLSPASEIEMSLDSLSRSFAVEQLSSGLWAATSTARAADLRAFARASLAVHLRSLRARRSAGTLTNGESLDLCLHADTLRARRKYRRDAARPISEQIVAWNLSLAEAAAATRTAISEYQALGSMRQQTRLESP